MPNIASLVKDKIGKKQNHKASFMVLLFAAVAALIAAFVLSLEKIHLMSDPDAVLSCSLNFVLNCSTVMQSWQSGVFFGIPNMFIGLMAFPVLITVAVSALWGGLKFNKGFLRAMFIGVLMGTVFAYWLFFSSLYDIQVLCPWCLVVTTACTLMLAAVTHIAIREKVLGFKSEVQKKLDSLLDNGYHQLIVAAWLVTMVLLVFIKFGFDLFI